MNDVICLGLVILIFGGIPPHETDTRGNKTYIVRQADLDKASPKQLRLAKLCAARHGIRYRTRDQ